MIFVVDDSVEFLEIFEMVISELNIPVKTARSGVEGLKFLNATDLWPEAIFVDFFMPDMTGEMFVNRLHKEFPGRLANTQLIVLTNLPMTAPQLNNLIPIVNKVIPKPADLSEFKKVISASIQAGAQS